MLVPFTPAFGPSHVHSLARDLCLNVCDPRATINLFSVRAVCVPYASLQTVGDCAAPPPPSFSAPPCRPNAVSFAFMRPLWRYYATYVRRKVLTTATCRWRVNLHHHCCSLCRFLLLLDLLSLLSVLINSASHAHRHLRPCLVVRCSPDCFGLNLVTLIFNQKKLLFSCLVVVISVII
ncbi:hypothetical protein ACOSQ2_013286 [Xanthoceras sorbifolium]